MKNPSLLRLFVWMCCFLFSPVLFGQPVVSNVRAQQGSGDQAGLVMITYDLASPAGPCTVTLRISADGGASFNVPAHTLSGAIGPRIAPGTDRLIIWDAQADWPSQYSPRMRFRVIADDGVVVVPQRVIALSGDLSFGEVTVGQTVTRTLTLSNTGNTELIVTGIMSALGFQAAWAGVIPAGESREVPVTFAPSAVRSYSGMLTVNSDATGGLNQIEVSGTGTAVPTATRVIALSGDLSFGEVTVGQTATRTLTISNTGNSTLTVSSINYPGGFSGNWSGGTIAAGGNRSVTVTFAPTEEQAYSGNVTVSSDATSGLSMRALSGTGTTAMPTPAGMVRVEGGTLPASSPLGAVDVATFYIGRYEVTWGEWQAVRTWAVSNGYDIGDLGDGCADDHPVHMVNWFDVLKWSNAKSEMEGLAPVYSSSGRVYRSGEPDYRGIVQNLSASGYRLPLEAEWEFAARGGNQTNRFTYSGSNDLNAVGWYAFNSSGSACNLSEGRGTWPVGQKAPNELGLYDMTGNVAEWCWDRERDGSAYWVMRGGSWNHDGRFGSVSYRGSQTPKARSQITGFRLARSNVVATRILALSGDLDFGEVGVGQMATRTLTIQNIGNSPLTVTGITYPEGFSGDWSGEVAAGDSQGVTVTFAPDAVQSYSGNVTVSSNASSGTNTRALSGTGTGGGGATPAGMVLVEGGILPASSPLGAVAVSTFYIGRYEVTWGEWQEVLAWAAANGYEWASDADHPWGLEPSGCADDHPVHSVSWFDALKWSNAKSEMEGLEPIYTVNGEVFKTGQPDHTTISQNLSANGYRLPLEAEWEFAARGGNQTNGYTYAGSNDLNAVGWYWDNSGGAACNLSTGRGTWPVGKKASNELRLYDMSGNVWEWCWNQSGSYRRVRGGSWVNSAGSCTVSSRVNLGPGGRYDGVGFRLARSSGS